MSDAWPCEVPGAAVSPEGSESVNQLHKESPCHVTRRARCGAAAAARRPSASSCRCVMQEASVEEREPVPVLRVRNDLQPLGLWAPNSRRRRPSFTETLEAQFLLFLLLLLLLPSESRAGGSEEIPSHGEQQP
ncbi:hypothetical protein EYF80_029181 [Liparis tanakae]|uniref:Uncharacterized protein n=1 Tax=Liparis tanakae TaxID=230148 RepID=A0A4Z2H528_9TELE|nr:hypothetical protein EYF80_029181 [Liparis tanakae]